MNFDFLHLEEHSQQPAEVLHLHGRLQLLLIRSNRRLMLAALKHVEEAEQKTIRCSGGREPARALQGVHIEWINRTWTRKPSSMRFKE